MFDRVTGRPVWPIEERPVPKVRRPGREDSPTQPYPTKPPAYARNFVNIPDDIIDFTPEMRAQALKQLERYKPGPLFNPPILGNVNGLLGALTIGDLGRRHQLAGRRLRSGDCTSFSRRRRNAGVAAFSLVPPPAGFSDIRYVRGVAGQPFVEVFGPGDCCAADSPRAIAQAAAPAPPAPAAPPAEATAARGGGAAGGGGGLTVQGLPIVKPPYGVLSAINLDRGELMWSVPHGDTPDGVRNHPALKGLNIPKTGQQGSVGLLVTKTLAIMGDPQVTTTARGRAAPCCAPTTRRPAPKWARC